MTTAASWTSAQARRTVYDVIEGKSNHDWRAVAFRNSMIIVIVANVVAGTLDTVQAYTDQFHAQFQIFEAYAVAVFTIEYFLRAWVSVENKIDGYQHPLTGRISYLLKPMQLIDLAAFLPYYIGIAAGFDATTMAVLCSVRLLKLARYSLAIETVAAVIAAQRRPLIGSVSILLILLFIAASLAYSFEHEAQPQAFADIPSAMWWGIVTLTTVGYGDITPITLGGRILGGCCMILGIGMLALPAGILATGFVEEFRKRDFSLNLKLVSSVPLFAGLDAGKITEIVNLLHPQVVPEHYTIFRRGEPADAMYFIIQGEVEIDLHPKAQRLKDGDYFGEIALLRATMRSATVFAVTECRLLALHVDDFKNLLNVPELHDALTKAMHDRLAQLGLPDEPKTDAET
jgi:voltage-gated potassium channel